MSGLNNETSEGAVGDNRVTTNGAEVPGFEPGNIATAEAFERKLDELLRRENLQDLSEENKQGIKALLKLQRAMGGNQFQNGGNDERLLIAGMHRPPMYSPTTMTIRQFLCGYEAFVRGLGLAESAIIRAFVTYLPPKLQERIGEAVNLVTSSWAAYKKGVRKILEDSSRYNELKARFDILKISQKVGESVHEFGERLRDLGNIGFPNKDPNARSHRESVLKDALVAGILNDEVCLQLIRCMNRMNFDELLVEAVTLESSHQARNTIRRMDDAVEVSVRRTEKCWGDSYPAVAGNVPSGPSVSWQFERDDSIRAAPDYQYQGERSCWFCGRMGHLKRDCWDYRDSREYNSAGQGRFGSSNDCPGNQNSWSSNRNDRDWSDFDDYPDNFAPGASRNQGRN